MVISATVLTVIGILVSLAIGLPSVLYTRRQTRIAEAAHRAALSDPRRDQHIDVLVRIRAERRVRIGIVHYPPFTSSIGDERESGLYVDLLRALCDSEGIEPVFVPIRFSGAVDAVCNDHVDMILSIFQTPRRSKMVDFCAFMHMVTVSGVVRRAEDRILSQSDLLQLPLRFVVCKEEIGHELLEDQLKVPLEKMTIIDTSNIADIIEMVAAKKADIAIADSLSCQHSLAARGAEGPRLKPVLRRRPLYQCYNGIMIKQNQKHLAEFLEKGIKPLLVRDDFRRAEAAILEEYYAIISKV
jgi:ABC-type amino acid transport substrate-binding protein